MNLKLFPLDTQTCHLTIASYGWTANDLIYTWKVKSETLTVTLFAMTGLQMILYTRGR